MTPIALSLEDAQEGGDGVHRLELRHPLAGLLQARVKGRVRRHDHLGRVVMRPRVLLYEARDTDAFFGEDLSDRGQHACPVVDSNPVVGTRLHLTDRNHSDAVVEAERWPALHAAPYRSRQIDEVADD